MKTEEQPLHKEFLAYSEEHSNTDTIRLHRQFGGYLYQMELFKEAAWYAERLIDLQEEQNLAVPAKDYEQSSACYYAQGLYEKALQKNNYLLSLDPDNARYLRFSGLYHMLLGKLERAEHFYLQAMRREPQDHSNHDALAHLYGLKGHREKVRQFGNSALALKDRAAFAPENIAQIVNITGQPIAVTSDVPPFKGDDPAKNVIAFSLWGDDPQYLQGAVLNATVAPAVYPGWQCRFYCDTTVPEQVIHQLKTLGADVRVLEKNSLAFFGLFWRFFVADDPHVDRYIIRDCDCILNCQERVAVDEWIASGKHFHVMRDYSSHTELIHAGLWGGVAKAIPGISDLIVDFYDNNPKERTIDQRFLRYYIWPFVKTDYLCHDSHFAFNNSRNFSNLGRYPEGTGNVGINWQSIYNRQ